MSILDTITSAWSVDESNRLPTQVDLITLVSIGSTATCESNGMQVTVKKALDLLDRYNNEPWVVYGAFTGNGQRTVEEEYKKKYFPTKSSFAGRVETTIGECLAYKKAFPNAREVIFITEEAHSRRARLIWRCLWPEANVYIVPVKLADTIDKKALMWPYRNAWIAFLFQALPTIVYKPASMLGPGVLMLLEGFHQPVSNE